MKKVAVVTGAARGIGLATVKHFLAEGWQVAMLDVDRDAQNQSCEDLNSDAAVIAIPCDVSCYVEVEAAANQVLEKFGRIDALVNNAGIAIFKPVLETSIEDWSRVLDVNLTGPFICSKIFAAFMLMKDGGTIVNVTSISGARASTLRVAYGTSKAGLVHLTKQLGAELGALGVRVNAVSPGPVETAMAQKVHTAEIRADYHDAIPLGRYGLEEELARAIYFLSSEESSYINGETLNVDGGFAATGIGLASFRDIPK